ncbi:flippase-like domain-containing protein [Collinsella sp. AGMB00827]|uniref:Flippase-like domain-containing protein n=1 Tax=Collinsella ureilytica TaxID=2869515 RepID=A0ABS7MID1_9ACTN|nr:lysylphosphatidylglycerol synthase transmembrane domain-containing protein [Collinsella urealyticum]MBY4796851.1 flippase-like domain-containing protein [Collinsella urealyticum]
MTVTSPSTPPAPQVDAPHSGDDRKGATRGAIFIGCALIAFLVYLVLTGQVAQFMEALSNVQGMWLTIACLCMLLYLVFGIAAYAIAVWLDPESPVGIRDLISVEASGIFFGNLTPMMMGSTPAQIYRLTKAGQNVGEAGAIQFTRFIVYQFGLVVWGAILLAARMPFFIERYSDIGALTVLCIFSFGGHVGILLLIFAIALMPKTVVRVSHWGLTLLGRLGFDREKIERWRGFVDGEVYSFSDKFKLAAAHASSMALTVVITMLQLAFFYLVPYFLMLAFGHHEVDFLSVMAASAFVQLLSSAVPLPGGTGGAEGGFALFLGHFYGSAATAGYLLWRLITFIIPTIVAAPLLGLRSSHEASIHDRWDRLIATRARRKHKREKTAARSSRAPVQLLEATGDQEKPVQEVRSSKAAAVRRTAEGITVSPEAMRKRVKARRHPNAK